VSPRPFQVRELLIALNRQARTPLAHQLENQLRDAILRGRLASGQQLPSTRMLAEQLGVSRGVVLRAYAQLGAEGHLTLRQGANPLVRVVGVPGPDILSGVHDGDGPRFRYDLRPERPDLSQFPRGQWLRSLRHALDTATDAEVGYIDSRGLRSLREEIARYLARARGLAVTANRIVITGGSTHALVLIERVLVRQGKRVIAFENPSHELLHTLSRRAGLEPLGIPIDDDGLLVDELRRSAASAVVAAPAHQFPIGLTYSKERQLELLRWADETDSLIVEDDFNAGFRYDRAPIGAIQGSAPERVAYIGSISKTLAPGLRLGWAVLPASLVDDVAGELEGAMQHLPALEQLALADFVRRAEFDRHLRRLRGIYRKRRDLLVRTLRNELPQYPVRGIAGGMHVFLELPSVADEANAWARARQAGLGVESIGEHALAGYGGPRGLLIGYGAEHERALIRAAHELAGAIRESVGRGDKPRPLTHLA
jgi:GntR family transcriptional regulator / MocR family aminotransferase